jgi:3-dehydroquinate dehydratase
MRPANQPTIKGVAVCHKSSDTHGLNTAMGKMAKMTRISQYVFQSSFQLKYFVTALYALGSIDA